MSDEYGGIVVGSKVVHVKGGPPGFVTELDSEHDLGGVTTCRVAWDVASYEEALTVPREDQSVHWTNKLICLSHTEKTV